jgi:hypothetical protein
MQHPRRRHLEPATLPRIHEEVANTTGFKR